MALSQINWPFRSEREESALRLALLTWNAESVQRIEQLCGLFVEQAKIGGELEGMISEVTLADRTHIQPGMNVGAPQQQTFSLLMRFGERRGLFVTVEFYQEGTSFQHLREQLCGAAKDVNDHHAESFHFDLSFAEEDMTLGREELIQKYATNEVEERVEAVIDTRLCSRRQDRDILQTALVIETLAAVEMATFEELVEALLKLYSDRFSNGVSARVAVHKARNAGWIGYPMWSDDFLVVTAKGKMRG